MKNKLNKLNKIFFALILVFSVFNMTSCDPVAEVSLEYGLQSIAVTHLPAKIKYARTDTVLDLTGLVVTATYRTGLTKVIPHEELTFSGFKESLGTTVTQEEIKITYKEGTTLARYCSFYITYTDVANISVTAQPDKTSYSQNVPLDLTGLVITAAYPDNSTQIVFSSSILEDLYTKKYGNDETVITEAEYLKIKAYCGRNDSGCVTALTIPLEYQLDSDNNFVLDTDGNRILTKEIEFSGFDDTEYAVTESSQTIVVKYTEITDGTYSISKETSFGVKLAKLAGLSVATTPSKIHYSSNTVLSFDGINLKASYSDGSSETIFTKEIYDSLDTITEEKKAEIESFVGGAEATLTIPLEWKKDTDGNYVLENGEKVAARKIVFSEFNSVIHSSNQTVNIKYTDSWGNAEQTAQASFTILFESLNGISLSSEPSKMKYRHGEALSLSGMRLLASYQSGVVEELYTDSIFSSLTTLTEAEKAAVLAYTGSDDSALIIPLEWKRDSEGNIVQESGVNVAARELKFEGFNSSKNISSETLTITLTDNSESASETFQTKIGVSFVDLAAVSLSAYPVKLKYVKGEALDLSGIIITGQYEDNSLENLFSSSIFTDLTTLTDAEKTEVKAYTGAASFGRTWYGQLETDLESSNTLTIPLGMNASGECVKGFTVIGFDSTQTVSSQSVRIRYVDNTQNSPLIKEMSFQVTYANLAAVSLSAYPAKLKYVKGEALDLSGIIITGQYEDNSLENLFTSAIFTDLTTLTDAEKTEVKAYTGAASFGRTWYGQLETDLESSNTLTIPLEMNASGECVKGFTVIGFDSTQTVSSQSIRIRYVDNTQNSPLIKEMSFQVTYANLNSVSIKSPLSKTSYIMDSDSVTGIVGGIGRTGVNRTDASASLDDIGNWHFDVEGLQLVLSYVDGSSKTLTFANDSSCYGTGTGTDSAYVVESSTDSTLKYMQRWSNETDSDGNKYKITIEGFDPIAVFKASTTSLSGIAQAIKISYTEDGTTVSTSAQISYTFAVTYQKTKTVVSIDGSTTNIKFGDYPQTKLKSDSGVVVNKAKYENAGLFYYHLGSDGNYYCDKEGTLTTYYKVEPITWVKVNDENYYRSEKILDSGIPYYQGEESRKTSASDTYSYTSSSTYWTGTITYEYDIPEGSFIYSTARNWLNGNNLNGDNTYDGKGFLQTAFSTEAQSLMDKISLSEFFYSDISVTAYGGTSASYGGGSGFIYEKKANVKVMLPCHYNAAVAKFYYYPTDSGTTSSPSDRIKAAESADSTDNTNYWAEKSAYYGDAVFDSNNKTTKPTSKSLCLSSMPSATDFAGSVSYCWLASDVRTLCTKPDSSDISVPTSKRAGVIYDSTYDTDVNSKTDGYGLVPVIRLE